MQIDVSVVIPCFNCAATVGEQLSSLCRQVDAPSFGVVVVDDGSTDHSAEVVEAYRGCLDALTVLHERHSGNVGHVRNLGARNAKGRLLLFCDADDVVGPRWVAVMVSALAERDFVAGSLEYQRLNPDWVLGVGHSPQTNSLQQWGEPPFMAHAGGGNLAIRREVFEAVGGFDEDLPALEDTDFCFRAQLRGHELGFVAGAEVSVRLRPSLGALYRQAHAWGYASVALHRRYLAHGMPRPNWVKNLGGWVLALPRLLLAYDRARLGRWVFRQGWRAGRLRGGVRYRMITF